MVPGRDGLSALRPGSRTGQRGRGADASGRVAAPHATSLLDLAVAVAVGVVVAAVVVVTGRLGAAIEVLGQRLGIGIPLLAGGLVLVGIGGPDTVPAAVLASVAAWLTTTALSARLSSLGPTSVDLFKRRS